MIKKRLIQIGNPLIAKKCKKVGDVISSATRKIVRDLTDTIRHHDLVGIAANQISVDQRIFVMEIRKTRLRSISAEPLQVFINPVIVWQSKK